MTFFCPLCTRLSARIPLHREDVACETCGATWRAQACMLTVMEGLGYPHDVMAYDLRSDWSRIGLGISDDFLLARRLSQLFFYTNSFYHQFPRVDITNPPAETLGRFEFIVCSDVLEHVPPPVDVALVGLLQMLKPGGFAVLSVPCQESSDTLEYYPELSTFEFAGEVLHWTDSHGQTHTDNHPEMHGGAGQTLAFRHWARQDLINRLLRAGFSVAYSPLRIPPISDANNNIEHAGLVIARV